MSSDAAPGARLRGKRLYWVRSGSVLPAPDQSASTPLGETPKRFVEPVRLSAEQRARLLAPLAGHGIGDAPSRELFVAAMEYDLAGCRALQAAPDRPPAATQPPSPASGEPSLRELGVLAETLARHLAGLDESAANQLQRQLAATDRFARGYDSHSLRALRGELERLGQAAGAVRPADPPRLPEAARWFVRRAAEAFRDCFEWEPGAAPGEPFLVALAAVVEVGELAIPLDPAGIQDALG